MSWSEQCCFIFIFMMSDRKKMNQKSDLNLLHTSCISWLILTLNNVKRSQIHIYCDRFLRNFLHVACIYFEERHHKSYYIGMEQYKNIIILMKKQLYLPTCCTLTSNNVKQRQSTITLIFTVLQRQNTITFLIYRYELFFSKIIVGRCMQAT